MFSFKPFKPSSLTLQDLGYSVTVCVAAALLEVAIILKKHHRAERHRNRGYFEQLDAR